MPDRSRPRADQGAVVALVCSGFGLLCFVPAIAGIMLGVRARRRIEASGGVLGGHGLATAAVWLGAGLCVAYVTITLYRFVF